MTRAKDISKIVSDANFGGTLDVAGVLTGTSLDISGDIDIDGVTNLDIVDIDGAVDFASTTAHAGNATFADNAKAIFGSELEIYSDATHARIKENGSGQLKIQGNNMQLLTSDGTATYLEGNASTGVTTLYHASNAPRIATTSTGIDVTGTVTSTGTSVFASLDISGDIDVDGTTNLDVVDIDGAVDMATTLAVAGNVDFNGDLDVDGTTNLDVVDIDGAVAINAAITIQSSSYFIGNSSNGFRFNNADDGQTLFYIKNTGEAVFNDNSLDYDFRVESDGNANMLFVDGGNNAVGVGTSSPATTLDVVGVVSADGLSVVGGPVGYVGEITNISGAVGGRDGLKVETLLSNSTTKILTAASNSIDRFVVTGEGDLILGSSTNAYTLARLDHENSGGKGELQLNAHGSASFSMLSNFTGSTVNGVATGNFGLITPHNAGISINTSDLERMKIDGSGNTVFNETGADADFRVESDSNTHAIYVDGGNNSVTLGSSSSASNTFRVSFGGFQVASDASFSTTKSYTFRDAVGIDNPNSQSYSTATSAVLCVGAMLTGRSINATGTVNASGADYAEYEANNGLVISKGSIIGFKADGTLTLTFSEAVRFAVKSTDPAYVGGDTWSDVEPPEKNTPAWDTWFAETETKRAKVDRVAYSGKVPVNVQGATSGQYIIAIADSLGEITGQAVTDPDFSQYKLSVGRVNKILEDGRAEIAVIIH